jgi:hypothetical protein
MATDINNPFLINAYDFTESLIQQTPANEDQLITKYINFIIEYNSKVNLNKSYVRTASTEEPKKVAEKFMNHPTTVKNSLKDYYKEMTGEFVESYSFV